MTETTTSNRSNHTFKLL